MSGPYTENIGRHSPCWLNFYAVNSDKHVVTALLTAVDRNPLVHITSVLIWPTGTKTQVHLRSAHNQDIIFKMTKNKSITGIEPSNPSNFSDKYLPILIDFMI